ncbi:unnamed protein product [Sphacelaria rigidula]
MTGPLELSRQHKGKGRQKSKKSGPGGSIAVRGNQHKGSKRKKKHKMKVVSALVLSPEIQAALARGDTVADDSDSDLDNEATAAAAAREMSAAKRRAAGGSNDLLSLLPQPSTATSADDILRKSQQKRRDSVAAKKVATSGQSRDVETDKGSGGAAASSKNIGRRVEEAPGPAKTTTEASLGDDDGGPRGRSSKSARPGREVVSPDEEVPKLAALAKTDDRGSDSEPEGDEETTTDHSSSTPASLFTLPSRSKPKSLAPAPTFLRPVVPPSAETRTAVAEQGQPTSGGPSLGAPGIATAPAGVGAGAGSRSQQVVYSQQWGVEGAHGAHQHYQSGYSAYQVLLVGFVGVNVWLGLRWSEAFRSPFPHNLWTSSPFPSDFIQTRKQRHGLDLHFELYTVHMLLVVGRLYTGCQ